MSQSICTLCPRNCKVDRTKTRGFCGAPALTTVSKIMLHQWEEPCICYGKGSGAVFFSGCQLRCVFCQNHEISSKLFGKELSSDELCDLFLRLEQKGACNINLVSPTPYVDKIIKALKIYKPKIPIVYNTSGFENVNADAVENQHKQDIKNAILLLLFSYAKAEAMFEDEEYEGLFDSLRNQWGTALATALNQYEREAKQ